MDENVGLANRRLQPLGHVSGAGHPYKTPVLRSNPPGDSRDSCDSYVVQRVHKGGHKGPLPHPVELTRKVPAARKPEARLAAIELPPARPAVVTKEVTAHRAWQRTRWLTIRARKFSQRDFYYAGGR